MPTGAGHRPVSTPSHQTMATLPSSPTRAEEAKSQHLWTQGLSEHVCHEHPHTGTKRKLPTRAPTQRGGWSAQLEADPELGSYPPPPDSSLQELLVSQGPGQAPSCQKDITGRLGTSHPSQASVFLCKIWGLELTKEKELPTDIQTCFLLLPFLEDQI